MTYDLAVIGRGPAGLSAALNAGVRNKSVIIFGNKSKALEKSESIKNCLGFFDIKGADLYQKFEDHLKTYNPDFSTKRVQTVYALGKTFALDLGGGEMVEAGSVIIATGKPSSKGLPGEEKFFAKGLSYCATCDASLYRGKEIVILAYNREAFEEATFCSEIVGKVTLLNLTGEKIDLGENIEIIEGKTPKEIIGEDRAQSLVFTDGTKIDADGFFIIKDASKPDRLVPSLKVEENRIPVNQNMETNIKGLFAAGDITGPPYQIQKSLGQGQIAGLAAASYLSRQREN